jgi:chorismate mutase
LPYIKELIKSIYVITLDVESAIKEDNYEEVEKLLSERNTLMNQVDSFKAEHPTFEHSENEKQMLEDTLSLDKKLTSLLKENISETQTNLNQMKKEKQVAKKYHPYSKQTSGVFLDEKK